MVDSMLKPYIRHCGDVPFARRWAIVGSNATADPNQLETECSAIIRTIPVHENDTVQDEWIGAVPRYVDSSWSIDRWQQG